MSDVVLGFDKELKVLSLSPVQLNRASAPAHPTQIENPVQFRPYSPSVTQCEVTKCWCLGRKVGTSWFFVQSKWKGRNKGGRTCWSQVEETGGSKPCIKADATVRYGASVTNCCSFMSICCLNSTSIFFNKFIFCHFLSLGFRIPLSPPPHSSCNSYFCNRFVLVYVYVTLYIYIYIYI